MIDVFLRELEFLFLKNKREKQGFVLSKKKAAK